MAPVYPTKNPRAIAAALAHELRLSAGPGAGLDAFTLRNPRKGQEPRRNLLPHETGWQAVNRLRNCGSFPHGRVEIVFPGGHAVSIGRHACTHRLCPHCGKRRGAKLAEDMARSLEHLQNAWKFGPQHLRFATFTIPNTRNIAEGIEWIAQAWHRALATKTWGRLIAGGFRTWEVKPGKDGKWNVHLHAILVLWNGRIPYEQLRGIWDQAARLKCNIRFDELRGIKARNGRTKAASVAAYITKYLVKVEDLGACASMPGGLPHLTAALEGRRLFGAFGCGAIARRWIKAQRPLWIAQITRAMLGYRDADGLPPVAAFIEDHTGTLTEAPIPAPPPPSCIDLELLDTHPGFASDTVAQEWDNPGPKAADLYPWRKVPRTQEEADARAATARTLNGLALAHPTMAATFRALARAITPPKAFCWGRWWQDTKHSAANDPPLNGYQRRRETWALRSLNPALVPTVETPHHEPLSEWLLNQLDQACMDGCKTAETALKRKNHTLGWAGAREWMATLPAHVRAALEEPHEHETAPARDFGWSADF